jgi:hypothetical protein
LETAKSVSQQFQAVVQQLKIPNIQIPVLEVITEFSRLAKAFDSDHFNKRLDSAIANLATPGMGNQRLETPIQMIVETSDLFNQGDLVADEVPVDHFREIATKILASASKAYPDRAKIRQRTSSTTCSGIAESGGANLGQPSHRSGRRQRSNSGHAAYDMGRNITTMTRLAAMPRPGARLRRSRTPRQNLLLPDFSSL